MKFKLSYSLISKRIISNDLIYFLFLSYCFTLRKVKSNKFDFTVNLFEFLFNHLSKFSREFLKESLYILNNY